MSVDLGRNRKLNYLLRAQGSAAAHDSRSPVAQTGWGRVDTVPLLAPHATWRAQQVLTYNVGLARGVVCRVRFLLEPPGVPERAAAGGDGAKPSGGSQRRSEVTSPGFYACQDVVVHGSSAGPFIN